MSALINYEELNRASRNAIAKWLAESEERMIAATPRHALYAACVIHFAEIHFSPDWSASDRARAGHLFDAALDFISACCPVDGAAILALVASGDVDGAAEAAQRACLRIDMNALSEVIRGAGRSADIDVS
ncbi:hypothetical protein [Paraburkholderia graminis]|uniref:hypothetical protein n=1 Tax=Paraburkholderia graminis TaxID=60548 RepID=UPI0038BAC0B0